MITLTGALTVLRDHDPVVRRYRTFFRPTRRAAAAGTGSGNRRWTLAWWQPFLCHTQLVRPRVALPRITVRYNTCARVSHSVAVVVARLAACMRLVVALVA